MRGPKLVGYPQTGLRWSGDSARLYFEWRRPGDDEAVDLGRRARRRRSAQADRRRAPQRAAGQRRVGQSPSSRVFADQGDIVLVDSVAGTRRQITRTTGGEVNPRWARGESAVTFIRDNNLFLVPLDGSSAGIVAVDRCRAAEARSARHRQPEVRQGRRAEADRAHAHRGGEEEEGGGERQGARAAEVRACRASDGAATCSCRPTASTSSWSIVERAETAKRPNVPNYVTESSYTEDIPARTFVGDAQDKRTLRRDESGDRQNGRPRASEFAGKARRALGDAAALSTGRRASRLPTARATDNKDRWLVAVDAESGKTRVVDALHDDAWVREVGGFGPNDPSFGWLPDQKRLWFLSERDGWMHLYTVDARRRESSGAAADARQVGNRIGELSADRKKFYITSTEVHPGERHLYSMPVDGGARTKLTSMTGGNAGDVSPDDSTIGAHLLVQQQAARSVS